MSAPIRIMASVASIPHRESSLQRVIESLLPQVDRLNVYLNAYERPPAFTRHPKIVVARSQEYGDFGDAAKFFWLSGCAQYFLTCDDDILYPADYVSQTVASIEKYGRKAIVGWQGSILLDAFEDYYNDESRRIFSFYRAVDHDLPVHILGTGALGFHVSTLNIAFTDFKAPNMADIWFGLKAQQQHVPLIVRAHRAGELAPIHQGSQQKAIWRDCIDNAQSPLNTRRLQSDVVKAHWPWVVHECIVPRRIDRIGSTFRKLWRGQA